MTKIEFENAYWKQYIELEKELIDIGHYISIEEDNFSAYSLVLQKYILEVDSELDNVMKEISGFSGEERSNIEKYYSNIVAAFPQIKNQSVTVNSFKLKPFDGWKEDQPSASLAFWDEYNAIKHNRVANKKKASLKNAVYALAALFILEMYEIDRKYKEDITASINSPEDDTESSLFIMEDWACHIRMSKIETPYTIIDDDTGEVL